MKKRTMLVLFIILIIPIFLGLLFYTLYLNISHLNKDNLQENCDIQSSIEYFLKKYEHSSHISYKVDGFDSEKKEDKDLIIYSIIKNCKYEEYKVSHTYDQIQKENIALIYGSGIRIEQNYVLFSDLEKVCIYQHIDAHIESRYSYRYYRINKEEGIRIMNAIESIESRMNEAN